MIVSYGLGDRWGAEPPSDYGTAIDAVRPGLALTVEQEAKRTNTDWIETATRIANTVLLTRAQKQLLDVQIQRARQGLAPLDASQYSMGVNVGIAPDTRQSLMLAGGVAIAMIALVAVLRSR